METKLDEWLKDPFDNSQIHEPSHYTQGDVECIEAIRSALGKEGFIAFCRGNAMKYTWRMMDKHDNGLADAQKAMKYLDWIVDELGWTE